MKKIQTISVLFVLFFGLFSFHTVECGMFFGTLFGEIKKNRDQAQRKYEMQMEELEKQEKEYSERFEKGAVGLIAVTKLKTINSEEKDLMQKRIADLLEQTLNVDNTKVFIFPTIKSKIFVLQNIEDFLSLPKEKLLLTFVYEECIKQIRDLENKLERKVDEEGNVSFIDKNQNSQLIDKVRNKYMQEYGITNEKIKINSKNAGWIGHKRWLVENGLKNLIDESAQQEKVFSISDPIYQAHISILAYLVYLAGDKLSMLSGQEYEEKSTQMVEQVQEKEAKQQELKALSDEQKKNMQFGSPQVSEQSKGKIATEHRITNFLSMSAGIAKAQLAHKKIAQQKLLKGKVNVHAIPSFEEKELPQNMNPEQQATYAKKIETLYPKRMNFWDKLWTFFGYPVEKRKE